MTEPLRAIQISDRVFWIGAVDQALGDCLALGAAAAEKLKELGAAG
jgi:hypothetical protein